MTFNNFVNPTFMCQTHMISCANGFSRATVVFATYMYSINKFQWYTLNTFQLYTCLSDYPYLPAIG